MDYMKPLRSLSAHAINACRTGASCAALILTALLISLSLGAQAAVLKINPSANSPNEINVSGELSASVTHTAEGMTIEIPGVEISLVCDTNTDPDLCTVTVGSGSTSSGSGSSSSGSGSASSGSGSSSSGSGSASSGSGSSSSGSGSSSSGSGDDKSCDPAFDFGCQDGTLGGTGSASGSDDSSDSSDSSDPSDSSDSSGSTGYVAPATSSSDEDDPCSRKTGYNPNCVTITAGTQGGDFPTGGARKVANASGDHNYGSANPTGKARITVPSGTVTVLGLVMKSGASPSSGTISFAQASNIQGVDLKAWISTSPDGARVGSCSRSGYAEGVLSFTIGGGGSCNLSPGSTYYFNMALCSSTPNDLYCNQAGAKAAAKGGIIVVSSDYSG